VNVAKAAGESPQMRLVRAGTEQFVAAFNEGDMKRASRALSEDYEQHFPPGFTQRELHGPDAWVAFFEELRRDMSTWQVTPVEIIEAGHNVFVLGLEYVGEGRSSGVPSEMTTWDVIELDENGLIKSDRQFFERAEALSAAELRQAEDPA
jgi:predicted SnoaL-like aldol condensation-catalyzing enzyme